jgi:hypothetical protein
MFKKMGAALVMVVTAMLFPLVETASAHADGWCDRTDGGSVIDCTYDGPHGGLCHHNTVCWTLDSCQVYDYCS